MAALGLNDHHQGQVVNYMRFARYQRGQRLRAVEGCFDDLKDSRLIDDTYTIDEVTDMLDGLLSIVRGEVESELINTSHTNVLLMRQVFQQAEKWHLKLQADISELENRELLERIADFEEREFAGTKRDKDNFKAPKLQPMNESGGAALLHMKIEELQEENDMLQARLRQIEGKVVGAQHDRHRLEEDLAQARTQGGSSRGDRSNEEVDSLRKQMSSLKSDMDHNKHSSSQAAEALEGDLTGTKHELLRVQEMLEMAEKELEKKVSQTMPFKNLKQMLLKKNDQIKSLRRRLSRYEEVDD